MIRISKNFYLSEFTESETALRLDIDNNPSCVEVDNITLLVYKVLQPLRDYLKDYIHITSGFRSDHLNLIIGGSKTSDHKTGKAADIKCKNMAKAFKYIAENLDYDQLIWEFGNKNQPSWIHVSFKSEGNRRQILQAFKQNGKTKYKIWGY